MKSRHPWKTIGLAALFGAAPLLVMGAVPSLALAEDGAILFTDVTAQSGIDFVQTIGDDAMTNIVESAGVGCGMFDYDGDGWLDIYFVNGFWMEGLSDPDLDPALRGERARATDRLYRSRGDGTFEDVTEIAGVNKVGYGMGVVAADYDGDGDTDIYVTNFGPNFLYRNEGDGTFQEVAEEVGVGVPEFSGGSTFLDYDRDGWLDLYVGNYLEYDPKVGEEHLADGFPGPLDYPGQQDRLFRNNGDGSFTEVTQGSGIEITPLGRAMGVGSFDFDNDGYMDVFVSNDAMENFLLRNRQDGTFEDTALFAGVAYGEAGQATAAMAVEVADIDSDGLFDFFVPDIESSCLYRNTGDGYFSDESAISGIAAASGRTSSWGAVFGDYDLDGFLDLYVANGDEFSLEPHANLLFRGDSRTAFREVSASSGSWSEQQFVSRGVARGDYDNDGDLDLLVTSLDDRPVLLRNDSPREGKHWISIRLVGLPPNRDAIGTRVRLTCGDRTQTHYRKCGGSYLSQHDERIHFGLGACDTIDELEIVWPDGSRRTLTDIPADRFLAVEQAAGGS